MSKIAIIYWSSTGNTESMANSVKIGAESVSSDVEMFSVSDFSGNIDDYSKVALGCPAMGSEELEDSEFQPFYESIKDKLSGKKVVLFGSYDWGDGEWMRTWQEDVKSVGADLIKDGIMANLTPDDSILAECVALGEALAKA